MEGKKIEMSTDLLIWKSFLKGDKKAFYVIYKQQLPSLFKYGLNFTNDKDLIKDCIHDVFVYIYTHRSNLNETNNIRLYLLKALKNSIIKAVSEQKKYLPI
jgi:DNA-directed RNA polymerase specialized sigma24 family protein